MKHKLYKIRLVSVQKVCYATNRKEALAKFCDHLVHEIDKITDIKELATLTKKVVFNDLEVEELKLPLLYTAYYRAGDRVLWHNNPGYIDSYSKTFLGKRYGYQINYNIKLDDGRSITNSRYDEIVNEDTLDPNIEGINV